MSKFIRVAAIDEVPNGTGKEVMAGDHLIALFHVDGEFFALDGVCPHAGGPLGQGELTDRVVTCPWHGWQFDIQTGRHCLNDKLTHPSFPVKVDDQDVLVDVGP